MKSYNTVKVRMIDKDDLSKTKLLAMSAVRAGLKPWSEECDLELVRVRKVLDAIKEAA